MKQVANDGGPWFRAGMLEESKKDFAAARAAYETALANGECSGVVHFRHGWACERLKDWRTARDSYGRAISSEPDRGEWHARLGRAEESLSSWDSAERSYRQALACRNPLPAWHQGLSRILAAQGRTAESRRELLASLPCHAIRCRGSRSRDPGIRFAWVSALREAAFVDDAFEIGIETARTLGADPSQRKLLLRCGMALGGQGRVEKAIAGMRTVASLPALAPFAREAILALALRYSFFDDEAMSMAGEILSSNSSDPRQGLRAATLRLYFDGPSLALAETMAAHVDRLDTPEASHLLDLAGILHDVGEARRLDRLLQQHPSLAIEEELTPATSHAALRLGLFGPGSSRQRMAERIISAHEAVTRCRGEIWAELSDPQRSVGVVGNSPCELGRGLGPRIDAHDLVVRFNGFSMADAFVPDYGSKVDIIARLPEVLAKYGENQGARDIIVGGVRPLDRYRSWELVVRLLESGHRIGTYPPELHQQLIRRHKRAVSSGLTMAWTIASLRGNTDNVDFYGFSFLDQVGPAAASAHYYEKAIPSGRHDWVSEADSFRSVTGIVAHPKVLQPPAAPIGPRIRLAGDHSALHAGCAAVFGYLLEEARSVGTVVDDVDFDVLVVNGEGSMHHDSLGHRRKMDMLAAAIGRGKRAFLINSVWQANDGRYDHILRSLDGIVVRESKSRDELLRQHRIAATVHIDVSYWAGIDENGPLLDMKGATVATDFYSRDFAAFVRPTSGWLSKQRYLDMSTMGWSTLVRSLRTASVLVTGRHHAVFAACRAKIPFVALRGNTHKLEGMIETSGIQIPIWENPSDLEAGLRWAKVNRSAYDDLFAWMDSQSRFRMRDLLHLA